MDPVVGLLFLLGIWYALGDAGRSMGKANRSARTGAAARATARTGSAPAARTAARQASTAWWAREAAHGFPTARHGFGHGWHQHRRAMAQRDRDRLDRDAERAEDQAGWRQALLDYRRRREAADDMGYEDDDPHEDRNGNMTERTYDDPPDPPRGRHRKPPGENCTNPDCTCHTGKPGPDNSNEKGPPEMSHSNGAGDLTLDELVALTEKGKQHADAAVNEDAVKDAEGIGDKVAGSFPNDRTIQGHAADYEAAVAKIREGNQEMGDAAAALGRDAESYRTMQEGVQASTGEDVTAEGVLTG